MRWCVGWRNMSANPITMLQPAAVWKAISIWCKSSPFINRKVWNTRWSGYLLSHFRVQDGLFITTGTPQAVLDLSHAEESIALAEAERRTAEDLRLLYVALTRAVWHYASASRRWCGVAAIEGETDIAPKRALGDSRKRRTDGCRRPLRLY